MTNNIHTTLVTNNILLVMDKNQTQILIGFSVFQPHKGVFPNPMIKIQEIYPPKKLFHTVCQLTVDTLGICKNIDTDNLMATT